MSIISLEYRSAPWAFSDGLPTPIYRLPGLADAWGIRGLYVKRDDLESALGRNWKRSVEAGLAIRIVQQPGHLLRRNKLVLR